MGNIPTSLWLTYFAMSRCAYSLYYPDVKVVIQENVNPQICLHLMQKINPRNLWYICVYMCMCVHVCVCVYTCVHTHACGHFVVYIYCCYNCPIQAGNITEFLLREGFARCVDWSMGVVTQGKDKLRQAEKYVMLTHTRTRAHTTHMHTHTHTHAQTHT